MKMLPNIIATVVSAIALVLGITHYSKASSNLELQIKMQAKQQEIQEINDALEILQREFQTQRQIIEQGASIAQKYGPPILRDIGILAAKNKNEKLKTLLIRNKLESFILTDEQFQKLEEQLQKQEQQKQQPPQP